MGSVRDVHNGFDDEEDTSRLCRKRGTQSTERITTDLSNRAKAWTAGLALGVLKRMRRIKFEEFAWRTSRPRAPRN